jgi:hypothetical protein
MLNVAAASPSPAAKAFVATVDNDAVAAVAAASLTKLRLVILKRWVRPLPSERLCILSSMHFLLSFSAQFFPVDKRRTQNHRLALFGISV